MSENRGGEGGREGDGVEKRGREREIVATLFSFLSLPLRSQATPPVGWCRVFPKSIMSSVLL